MSVTPIAIKCHWSGLPIWMAFSATWGHGDNQTQAAAEDHFWVRGPTIAEVYVNIHGPCYTKGYMKPRGLACNLWPC